MSINKKKHSTLLALAALPIVLVCSLSPASADPVLGSASGFAVLAGTTVTNAGNSIINGDLGVWPGAAITGFGPGPGLLGPGIVTGTQYAGGTASGPSGTAEHDLTTAYNNLAGLACGGSNGLTGTDLGGLTLSPGVYCFTSDAQLTGTLTLDNGGFDNQEFVFQIASLLNTATNSAVIEIGSGTNSSIFWQLDTATLGTATDFRGSIVALTSISLSVGARIACGSALAMNGAVTLLDNAITTGATCESDAAAIVPNPASVPTPGSIALLGLGFFSLIGMAWWGPRHSATQQVAL